MIATTFQETVVELTRQIDNLLFKLGGSGRNIDERASSLRHVFNAQEARRLHLVAKVTRKMVYGGGITIKREHNRFIHICGWMIYRLEAHLATHAQRQMSLLRPTVSRNHHYFAVGAGALGLWVVVVLCMNFHGQTEWSHELLTSLSSIRFVVALVVVGSYVTKIIARRR